MRRRDEYREIFNCMLFASLWVLQIAFSFMIRFVFGPESFERQPVFSPSTLLQLNDKKLIILNLSTEY